MTECKFCRDLKIIQDNRYMGTVEGFTIYHKYKAAMVDETYREFPNGSSNRAGVSTHYGYKLNYCPECGRKFKTEDFV